MVQHVFLYAVHFLADMSLKAHSGPHTDFVMSLLLLKVFQLHCNVKADLCLQYYPHPTAMVPFVFFFFFFIIKMDIKVLMLHLREKPEILGRY